MDFRKFGNEVYFRYEEFELSACNFLSELFCNVTACAESKNRIGAVSKNALFSPKKSL